MNRRILLFIALLLLLLLGLEKLYDYFLLKNVNLKSSFVASQPVNADVLFLGPCEPLWMMSPALFQKYAGLKGFNLSTVHANFAENESMLHLYLEHNKAPQYLFLYVTTESVDGAFNVFNSYSFSQFISDPFIKKMIETQDPDYYRWVYWPFMKHAYYNSFITFNMLQGVKHELTGRKIPYYPDGYVPPHGITWDMRYEHFVKEFPKGRHFEWNLGEVKSLQALLDLAKAYGIKVVLYESPMLNEIKPFILNRDEIKQKIAKFAMQNKVPYWVFDTMQISNTRSCFFSVLNTNDKGSAIFNKTFADYFLREERRDSLVH